MHSTPFVQVSDNKFRKFFITFPHSANTVKKNLKVSNVKRQSKKGS